MLFNEIRAEAAARGSEATHAGSLWILCMLDWLSGNWPRALDYSLVAREITELIGASTLYGQMGRVGALIEGDLGRVESARALARNRFASHRQNANDLFTLATLGALGRLELALGDLEAAARHLRELPAQLLAAGYPIL